MKKLYKTAQGQVIDFDSLRTMNEDTIAVGNYKVNARGDELGPGGAVIRTRDQVMRDYYALKTPVAVDENLANEIAEQQVAQQIPQSQGQVVADPIPVVEAPVDLSAAGIDDDDMGEDETVDTTAVSTAPPLRSSFAGSVAKNVTVTQTPLPNPKKAKGIQRF